MFWLKFKRFCGFLGVFLGVVVFLFFLWFSEVLLKCLGFGGQKA